MQKCALSLFFKQVVNTLMMNANSFAIFINWFTFDSMILYLIDPLEHSGENCWNKCNQQEGSCKWCVADGMCCRKGWIGNGCDGRIGGAGHQCVLNPGKKIYIF